MPHGSQLKAQCCPLASSVCPQRQSLSPLLGYLSRIDKQASVGPHLSSVNRGLIVGQMLHFLNTKVKGEETTDSSYCWLIHHPEHCYHSHQTVHRNTL